MSNKIDFSNVSLKLALSHLFVKLLRVRKDEINSHTIVQINQELYSGFYATNEEGLEGIKKVTDLILPSKYLWNPVIQIIITQSNLKQVSKSDMETELIKVEEAPNPKVVGITLDELKSLRQR